MGDPGERRESLPPRWGEPERGQSETIGVLLLLAITIIGAIGIVVFGSQALEDTEGAMQAQQAEHTFTQLDAKSAQVAIGEGESQTVDLPEQGPDSGTRVDGDAGWMRVRISNVSSGNTMWELNESLGAVVYEGPGETVAYQGGGVWRNTGNRSVMVSPPEFHYRGETLTLPIVTVEGNETLGGRATVSSDGATNVTFPDPDEGPAPAPGSDFSESNPVENSRITVTVHSDYYVGWGQYFETRTEGGVEYDYSNETTTVTLLQPEDARVIESGMAVIGGSGGGNKLTIQGGGGNAPKICSYNSSSLSPTRTSPPAACGTAGAGTDGDVVTTLDIEFKGGPTVSGNLTTSGEILGWGGSGDRVEGYLSYGAGSVSNSNCNSHVTTNVCSKNASIDHQGDVDAEVTNTINTISSNHDNGGEDCISQSGGFTPGDPGCGPGGSTPTIGAGDYYVDTDFLVNDQLVLDTTGGDIRIAVESPHGIEIDNVEVEIVGDGTVRLYTTEAVTVTKNNAKVWNEGWDSHQLWMLCSSTCDVEVTNGATFVGVIYAPGNVGGAGGGDIEVRQSSEVYGAVVGSGGGSTALFKNKASIHFDESLKQETVFDRATLPKLSYLHVTTNQVNVTSS